MVLARCDSNPFGPLGLQREKKKVKNTGVLQDWPKPTTLEVSENQLTEM